MSDMRGMRESDLAEVWEMLRREHEVFTGIADKHRCLRCNIQQKKLGTDYCSIACIDFGVDEVNEFLNRLYEVLDKYETIRKIFLDEFKSKQFYQSKEWREIRYKTIEKFGRRCMACGRTPEDGVKIHVDHIKPRSTHPELAFDLENLQILCEDCNSGKSNKFKTDHRPIHNTFKSDVAKSYSKIGKSLPRMFK